MGPLWESGVGRAPARPAGHRTEPRTRGGRTGNRKESGDDRTWHLDQGRCGRTKVEKTGRKEGELTSRKGMEAEGKAGENTTATRKRGKRNRASQPDRECIGEGRENQRWGKA